MKKKLIGNLKSKTVWFNLATAVAGVTAVLAANPAMLAAYGPHAIVAVTVVNVLLRNVTTKPVEEK